MKFSEFLAGLSNPLDALKAALIAGIGSSNEEPWTDNETKMRKYRRHRIVRNAMQAQSRRINRP